MTQSSVRTLPAQSGDIGVSGERRVTRAAQERAAQTARRRWLILFAAVLLVVVGVLTNMQPLTHFQDASARLNKATASVDTLQQQKAQLQSQLARLSEAGYLETLARQQMTYVRPGEELYIVTGTSGDATGGTGSTVTTPAFTPQGLGAGLVGIPVPAASSGTAGTESAGQSDGQTAGQSDGDSPGFFERAISAIRGIF
jgi:cell division protein FtsB